MKTNLDPDAIPARLVALTLAPAYRERLVLRTLEAIRHRASPGAQRVRRALDGGIRIPGFRSASKALLLRFDAVYQETQRSLGNRCGLAAAIFAAWDEHQPELRETVTQALAEAGLHSEPSYDTFQLESLSSPVQQAYEQCAREHPELDPDDLRLMFICQSGIFPFSSSATEPSADSIARAAGDEEGAAMIWDDWLSDLQALPPTAPEWDEAHLEGFIAALSALADHKRSQRATRQRLAAALERLRREQLERLRYIVVETAAEPWQAEQVALEAADTVASLVDRLFDALDEHRQIEERPASNAPARRLREADLRAQEDQIAALHDELAACFAADQTPPSRVEDPSDGSTERPAAAEPCDTLARDAVADGPAAAAAPAATTEVDAAPTQGDAREPAPGPDASDETRADAAPAEQPAGDIAAEMPLGADAEGGAASHGDPESELIPLDFTSPPREPDLYELDLPDPAQQHDAAPANDETLGATRAAEPPRPAAEPLADASAAERDGVVAAIAWRLQNNHVSDRPAAFGALIWQLLAEGRYDLSYHLTSHLGASSPIPASLMRALALAGNIRDDVGETAALLKHDYSLFQPIPETDNTTAALLTIAATGRPALLAPGTGAAALLKSIPPLDGLPQLHRYCQMIADYGQHLQPLDLTALRFVNNRAAWQTELEALIARANHWRQSATARTNKYAQASDVWRRWLSHKGPLKQLLDALSRGSHTDLATVRQLIDQLADPDAFRQLVDRTDRIDLGRRVGEDIHGPALAQLRQHTAEALGYARAWVRLQEGRPTERKTFFQQRAEELRREILPLEPLLIGELTSYTSRRAPLQPDVTAALVCCRRQIEQINELFKNEAIATAEIDPRIILHGVLLHSGEISLGDGWAPQTHGAQLEHALLQIARAPRLDWQRALDAWCELRDHEQSERVVEAARVTGAEAELVDRLEQRRQAHLEVCRQALARDIDETRRHVENAVAYGLLREEERNDFVSRIQRSDLALNDMLVFSHGHQQLQQLRDEIEELRRAKIASVRERLNSFHIGPEHRAFARITAVLDDGDALAADEYIDMVQKGQPIPEPQQQRDIFADFYPGFIREVGRQFEEGNTAQVIERMIRELRERARGRPGRISLASLSRRDISGPHADEAANLLDAWFKAKHARRLDSATASQIINNLGFRMLSLAASEAGRIAQYALKTRAIQNRTLSPIWQYGTGARGTYRLLCTWERPSETELISILEERAHDEPAIVFYFGRMTEQRRKDLARLCRERHVACVLIDDLLLMYLSTFTAPRLPHLFDCAMPFAHLDPYTTTAGIVPPEVFYGREHERREIIAPMGSCFIYGGRQLGKTALLRDIEREQHSPEQGRIVIWIDLKVEGIGNQQPIDAIWGVIARELQRAGVLPEKLPPSISVDRLFQQIQAWLDASTQRRILLLLDEADRFLANDGRVERSGAHEAFYRSAQIKGLMDRTSRRFKVVFAGLHNVKRTTRQSNHPLAHYGDPICIGPLLVNGEWRAARELIERPLASLGFRFASPDLVTRILSQTNYYPSLIQLYCKQLVKQLTDPHTGIEGPIYTITSRHVEEVYQSQTLRNEIRQRFNLTIQLDQRYEVIAYVVAYGSLSGDGRGMVEGFPVDWIRQQALGWWPDGFRESSSEDQILALLDEMVGLGILRLVQNGYYTLRSPNVVLLMGTLDQIEAELLRERETPVEYEAETFRAAFRPERRGERVDVTRRSPLTALQESELTASSNGALIIAGCRAAGRDELEPFITQLFDPGATHWLRFLNDRAAFKRELDRIIADRASQGTTMVMVAPGCPWSDAWIDDSLDRLAALRSRTAWLRVAFIADPDTAWRLMKQAPSPGDGAIHPEVPVLTLKPWHDTAVRQWLEDGGFSLMDGASRQELRAVTGYWPFTMRQFWEHARRNTAYWREALQTIAQSQAAAEGQQQLAREFELSTSLPLDVLRSIVQWGEGQPLSVPDIITDLGESAASRVRLSLRWADMLSFAYPAGNDLWRVDPVVQRALGM